MQHNILFLVILIFSTVLVNFQTRATNLRGFNSVDHEHDVQFADVNNFLKRIPKKSTTTQLKYPPLLRPPIVISDLEDPYLSNIIIEKIEEDEVYYYSDGDDDAVSAAYYDDSTDDASVVGGSLEGYTEPDIDILSEESFIPTIITYRMPILIWFQEFFFVSSKTGGGIEAAAAPCSRSILKGQDA